MGGWSSLVGPVALVSLALTGCGDDATDQIVGPADGGPSASTATTTATASPSGEAPGSCEGSGGSSPAEFDESAGTYAVSVDDLPGPGEPLTFDVVQWLSGEDARAAHEARTGDRGGPPNDYYVVNADARRRFAPLAADAEVLLVDPAPELRRATVADLPAHPINPGEIFWITLEDGTITGLCQQYRP